MLLQSFIANWKKNFSYLSSSNCHLLVAVSGGIDSVVLVHLLSQCGFSFSIAHCNFGLRAEESERDEMFVKMLAEEYGRPFFVKRFDTKKWAKTNRISTQEAARKLRYDWFSEIITSDTYTLNRQPSTHNFIVTAHHANDNIETLLINFFRGTGISGLHGILSRQNNLIRPLLFAKREEIEMYAKENGLQWVEDSSNATDNYTRNLFRHKLLPLLKEAFANVEDNLLHNIQRFSEAEVLYQQSIEAHKKKLIKTNGNEVQIPVLLLQKSKPLATIIWEILKDYNFTSLQVNDVQNLLEAENGKYVASSTHRIIRNRAWLIIAPLQTEKAEHILIEEKDKKVTFPNGVLSFKQLPSVNDQPLSDTNVATLDAKEIQYPLLLRKWKTGDYFYPLGMNKKKKLSKFFIDNKLSKIEKENVWVLEADKKIIWVIGYRIDDRFKQKSNTQNVLLIEKK